MKTGGLRAAARLGVVAGARRNAFAICEKELYIESVEHTADVIRRRVTGLDSQPFANAQITAVSYFGGITNTARPDVQPRRFEVKRVADEEVLSAECAMRDARCAGASTSTAAKGGLLYDIVNRNGEGFERVQLPPGRTLVGFSKNGSIYMNNVKSPTRAAIERAAIERADVIRAVP